METLQLNLWREYLFWKEVRQNGSLVWSKINGHNDTFLQRISFLFVGEQAIYWVNV